MNRIEISESAMMETLNALCGDERAQIVREVYALIEAAERRGFDAGSAAWGTGPVPASPEVLQAGSESGIYQAGYDDGYKDAAFDYTEGQKSSRVTAAEAYHEGHEAAYDEGFNDGANSVDFEADEDGGSTGYDVGYNEGFEDGFKEAQENAQFYQSDLDAHAAVAYENGYSAGLADGIADERAASEPLPGAIEYTEEEFYRAMDEAYERGFTDCSRNS